MVTNQFIHALQKESLALIKKADKGDVHNHIARGGSIHEYRKVFKIANFKKPERFNGYDGMEAWYKANIRKYYDNSAYLERIKLALKQLLSDGIKHAVVTYGWEELNLFGSKKEFVQAQKDLFYRYAPNIQLIPEFGINTKNRIEEIEKNLDEVLKLDFFRSVDIHGEELRKPYEYKRIYSRAYAYGLRLRAHIGETGGPEMIMAALNELELDEINHGNKAATDIDVIKKILSRKVRVNLCPYSNINLGLYSNLKDHPMKKLYDHGVIITVNTDDMLIFDKSISDIFLDLYQQRIFSAQELDTIRKNALLY